MLRSLMVVIGSPLRWATGFDNCLNLLFDCLSLIDSSKPDNWYPTCTRL